jgi:hypothetical protein
MNNFSALLCIIVLATAPACCKKCTKPASQESSSAKATTDKDVNTTIELDNTIFEVEEDNEQLSAVKF